MFYDVFKDESGLVVIVYNPILDIEARYTNVEEKDTYYIKKTIDLYLNGKQEPDTLYFASHKNEDNLS